MACDQILLPFTTLEVLFVQWKYVIHDYLRIEFLVDEIFHLYALEIKTLLENFEN